MGIRGLMTYMHSQPQFFQNYRLCNTKLVIDGNCIKHFMFNHRTTDFVHGGDYDEIDLQVNSFFEKLRLCNVSPYVVLDGGLDPDERKLYTTLQRKKEKIKRTRIIAKGGSDEIQPLFDNEVLKCRMRKLSIPFIVTEFEADYDMALLANDLDCPVLSHDSDFYVFPVRRGYLDMDFVNSRMINETNTYMGFIENYLECKIYYWEPFVLNHFPSLGEEGLCLLATLAGNDYVSPGKYDMTIQKALNECRRMKLEETENLITERRLNLCIELLHIPVSIEEAIRLLFPSNAKHAERSRKKFEKYMEFYRLRHNFTPLRVFEFFHPSKSLKATPGDKIWSVDGRAMPNWMLNRHRNGRIGNFEFDVFVKRMVCVKTLIEDNMMQGVFDSTRSIRQITYGIIVKGHPFNSTMFSKIADNDKDEETSSCDDILQSVTNTSICWIEGKEQSCDLDREYSVEEFTREGEDVHRFLVKANLDVPSLSEIPVISKRERKQLISRALGIDFDRFQNFSDKWKLLIGVIVFWMRKGTSKAQIVHMRALTTCITVLTIKEHLLRSRDLRYCRKTSTGDHKSQSLDQAISKMPIYDLRNIHLNFLSFFRKIDRTRTPTNISTVHIFQEFQAILKSIMAFNEFLLAPFPSVSLTETYRGSFIYSLTVELQSRNDQNKFIEGKLQRGSPVHVAVKAIQQAVLASL